MLLLAQAVYACVISNAADAVKDLFVRRNLDLVLVFFYSWKQLFTPVCTAKLSSNELSDKVDSCRPVATQIFGVGRFDEIVDPRYKPPF